jgi:(p)ppGpp synthase/HD superfamily hydrolase
MSTLERAIEIAARAHAGQEGKGGEPFILHPVRVMLRCGSDAERTTAILHDLIEKTPWTLDELRAEGFAGEVVAAVDALTRRDGEDYEDYVRRAATVPIGRQVKIADLVDHLERMRTLPPRADHAARLERYRRALAMLGGAIPPEIAADLPG